MSDYSKSVFKNPFFLRQKLNLYLQTPEKTELYARACEKFTKNGLLEWRFSWSWWAFFFPVFFFAFRKHYFTAFFALLMTNLCPVLSNIFYAMFAKYFIIGRFCEYLNYKDDDILIKNGGKPNIIVAILFFSILMFLIANFLGNYILKSFKFLI